MLLLLTKQLFSSWFESEKFLVEWIMIYEIANEVSVETSLLTSKVL